MAEDAGVGPISSVLETVVLPLYDNR